jgi:hypothetical protein
MDTNLNDMLNHIVNGDDDAAQNAFHGYVKDKMRSLLAGQSDTQSQTESQTEHQVEGTEDLDATKE